MKYQKLVEDFSWDKIMKAFDWNVTEKFNVAHECCDRWADDPNRIAIYWEDEDGNEETWSYEKLKEKSNRMANALKSLGVTKGDRVAGLLGKDMELIITILATWKIGAIYVPLFTAFGPEAIQHRLADSQSKLLLTNHEQAEKMKGLHLDIQIMLVDGLTEEGLSFWKFVHSFPDDHVTEPTKLTDPCVIQYTSGSTGLPKGAVWGHKVLLSTYPYQKYALGIEEDDVLYGGADLGWAYGLMNCTFAALCFGISIVSYKGKFNVEKVYQLLQDYKVTNFTYAPTAYRAIVSEGAKLIDNYQIRVKKFSSAGEPLNEEVVRFFKENFGREVYDQYGSTETLMLVNNYNVTDMRIKPGSMGFPTPGYVVELVDENGKPVTNEEVGQIAIDSTSFPFCFLGYWNNPEKVKEKKIGKWFLTGDLAMRDEEGYYWFQGRADDIISSSGYRIGPFEVESTVLAHPSVAEVAVVGKPDEKKGEIVVAFVVLNKSFEASDELAEEISLFVKAKLSKHQYPREIKFVKELPKTQSGKIQRFQLRNNLLVKEN